MTLTVFLENLLKIMYDRNTYETYTTEALPTKRTENKNGVSLQH